MAGLSFDLLALQLFTGLALGATALVQVRRQK